MLGNSLTPRDLGATFCLMSLKNIEKLESLVDTLAGEIRSLRAENRRLKEENARLGNELEKACGNEKKYRDKVEKLTVLERSHNKMEACNANARLKIQSMLAELEGADWS